MCASTGSSTLTSARSAGPSPFISWTASPIIRTYRSNPTPAMCPDCSPPTAFPAPADPAAQLVQLGQAIRVGPVHDQGVGVRDVQAGLHDRRADQHVELLIPEVDHDLLERVLIHLTVRDRDPGLGNELRHPSRNAA